MTIPLDPRFIPAFSIEDVLLDKDTGAPLAGGLVYFEQDNQRGVLKPVYQITGVSPNYTFTQLPNPIVLSSIGTFEDAIGNPVIPYFYPYDSDGDVELYYIRVTNSEDVAQFDREAQPYVSEQTEQDILSLITNEISNPQFAEVLFDTFNSTYTYTITAATDLEIPIAPDWDIVVSGTGTVTVAQLKPQGTLNLVTNPGTLLTISSTGLTQLHLRQRIYGSPNLWGSGYLSGTFVAKTYSGSTVTLNMYYSQSNGAVVDKLIVSGELSNTGSYGEFAGSVLIDASDSSDSFPDAYIDIFFDVPLSVQIDITSVMVAFTGDTSIDDISYDQESLARQVDHLFHYYKPQLDFKAIPSLLTGWDFPLNPAQFAGAGGAVTMTTTAGYVWDQTICKSLVGNIAVIKSTITSGFQATTGNANEGFYQIQYLSGSQARKILGTSLSVNINAFRTQAGGVANVQVYLYSGRAAATIPTLPVSLGTIAIVDTFAEFTLTAANWTLMPRGNLGQAEGTLSTVNTGDYSTLNDVVDLSFSGWEMIDSAQIADTDKFAIVVTYSCPTSGTVVTVDSIGLVPGDIPTRPAPQTADQVLSECEYYWEKSYSQNTLVGATNTVNARYAPISTAAAAGGGITAGSAIAGILEIYFNTQKRSATPNLVVYNPVSGSSDSVRVNAFALSSGSGNANTSANVSFSGTWTNVANGSKCITYNPNGLSSLASPTVTGTFIAGSAGVLYHYTIDARLGIV